MSPEGQQILVGEYLEVPLEDHPIAEIFPLLPDEELKELSRDIEEKGLRSPIMIHEGKILDGRNRYRAIKLMPSWSGKLDLWWLTKYLGPDPYEYVVSMNCRRRHLTTSQRAFIAVELVNMPDHRPSDKGANLHPYLTSSARASELLGVSERSVKAAKAIKGANPELFEAGKRGEISLNAAYQQIKPASESDQEVSIETSAPEETEPSANLRKVSQSRADQPDPPKSWTAPEMGENQDQSEQTTNTQLDTALTEAMNTAAEEHLLDQLDTLHAELHSIVEMIEASQQAARVGLLEPDEFREKLIHIRNLINKQIENLC